MGRPNLHSKGNSRPPLSLFYEIQTLQRKQLDPMDKYQQYLIKDLLSLEKMKTGTLMPFVNDTILKGKNKYKSQESLSDPSIYKKIIAQFESMLGPK